MVQASGWRENIHLARELIMTLEREIVHNDRGKDQPEPSALHAELIEEQSKQQQRAGAEPHTVTLTPVTQNGVTCLRHDGGTYPEDSHCYD